MTKDLQEFLKSQVLFKKVSLHNLLFLARYLQKRSFKKGEAIVRQGEHGQELFMIQRGHVEIQIRKVNGKHLTLSTLGNDDFFGEVALVGQSLRTATVKASSRVDCLTLHQDIIQFAKHYHPDLFFEIVQGIHDVSGQRIEMLHDQLLPFFDTGIKRVLGPFSRNGRADRITFQTERYMHPNYLKWLNIFRGFSKQEMAEILTLMSPKIRPARSFVYKERDRARHVYIILQGSVQNILIKKNSALKVCVFEPGYAFGQLSLFNRKPRLFTYMTREKTLLLECDYDTLLESKKISQSLREKFIAQLLIRDIELLKAGNQQVTRLTSELEIGG